MSVNISLEEGEEHYEKCKIRAAELSFVGQFLAQSFWGMERFGKNGADDPPPIYTDLAWQIQNSRTFRTLLVILLTSMELSDDDAEDYIRRMLALTGAQAQPEKMDG